MTAQKPRERRTPVTAAIGACRCENCVSYGRQQIRSGNTHIPWATVNRAVHSADLRVPESSDSPLPPGGHRTVTTADPAATDAAKKRYRHIYGIETPFSFTFDQAVGAAAGLTLSLPMISVFSMSPGVGAVVAMGLTTLGASASGLIRRSGDTEKRDAAKPVSAKSSRKARLASANADREAVLLAWAKYETDVALQIDYPAMTDVRKSETAALAKALRAAEIASRHAGESVDSLIRYEDAVLDLEAAFKAAETASKLDQEHPLSPDDKALAHTLLAMAVDPAGNVHERRQAHQRLLKLLDGVIVLSDPARLALEANTGHRQVQQ